MRSAQAASFLESITDLAKTSPFKELANVEIIVSELERPGQVCDVCIRLVPLPDDLHGGPAHVGCSHLRLGGRAVSLTMALVSTSGAAPGVLSGMSERLGEDVAGGAQLIEESRHGDGACRSGFQ